MPETPQGSAAQRLSRWRFVRHPSWGLRMIRNRLRDEVLWRQQGRPADGIVVVSRGELRVGPEDQKCIYGWSLSFGPRFGFAGPVTSDDLWSILERRYPETIRYVS